MSKNRLEAFSDGVLAIIITIMVLELAAPDEPDPAALLPLLPTFLSYALSFIFLGIYYILTRALIALHGRKSVLATAVGQDYKGKVSVAIYLAAIPLAFVSPWLAGGLYVLVAVLWLAPDRRIEKTLAQ
jgi:uncharacterized membrane protein